MTLDTERLILRSPDERDVDDYLEFCNSEFVMRYNAMTPRSREQVQAQFARDAASGEGTVVLELKATRKVIGAIFVSDDSLRWDVESKELSYFISETYSRQGYMKEALHAIISHLFEREELECVSARSFAPNEASRRLLISLGFHQDGLIPRCVRGYGGIVFDDAIYSVFRGEFQ